MLPTSSLTEGQGPGVGGPPLVCREVIRNNPKRRRGRPADTQLSMRTCLSYENLFGTEHEISGRLYRWSHLAGETARPRHCYCSCCGPSA